MQVRHNEKRIRLILTQQESFFLRTVIAKLWPRDPRDVVEAALVNPQVVCVPGELLVDRVE